jgi:hypothetical protein
MWCKEDHQGMNYQNSEYGFSAEDEEGYCAVDEDPYPFDGCEMFEPVDPDEYD